MPCQKKREKEQGAKVDLARLLMSAGECSSQCFLWRLSRNLEV